jgi:hypothetical protein
MRESLRHAWTFGPLLVSPLALLGAFMAIAGLREDSRDRAALRGMTLALLGNCAGYFMIYVLRPLDLTWLLDSSMDRLIIHLWPSVIFVVFLAARAPERSGKGRRVGTGERLSGKPLTGA